MRGSEGELGSAALFAVTLTCLLIGIATIFGLEIEGLGARRAEIRKIESAAISALERAGGEGSLACTLIAGNLSKICDFGGGEIALRLPSGLLIRAGWAMIART